MILILGGPAPMVSLMAFGRRVSGRMVMAASLCVAWGVMGCGGAGDTLDRQPVTGTVTLDGAPLETGTIRFLPESAEAATETSTVIDAGAYAFDKATGPVPGTYKVSISSVKGDAFEVPQGKMPGEVHPPPTKDKVPAAYNVKTTLTATVTSGHKDPINFDLKSKGG
jgi:hypothetical protein